MTTAGNENNVHLFRLLLCLLISGVWRRSAGTVNTTNMWLVERAVWAGRRERAGQESYERVSSLSVFPVQCPVD